MKAKETLTAVWLTAAVMLAAGVGAAEASAAAEEAVKAEPENASFVKSDEKWVKLFIVIEPSILWYLHYSWGEEKGEPYNRFQVSRGYLTLKFKPTKWFTPRITLDTTQDESGDMKVRLKYLYGQLVLPVETAFITEPNLEFGLVHGPWFDYEEHINRYRAQGTMFIERNKVINSADLGATVAMLLGPKLPQQYQDAVSKHYPGKWGSLAFGIYNGGGYHALEKNQSKSFQLRVSLRPLGGMLPNLQLSHYFIYGKGNTPEQVCDEDNNCIPGEPSWMLNAFMASYEHEYFVAAFQYAFGEGNQKGDKVDSAGKPLSSNGYSGFVEVRLPWLKSSLVGRYDHFEWGGSGSDRFIAGWAFHFYKNCFLLANLDWLKYQDSSKPEDWQAGLVMQVAL